MAKYLVIAASSTIGTATTNLLRAHQHEVITTARNNDKITPDFILDASDFNAVDALFQQVGKLDGVINCSGSLLLKPAHLTNQEQYQATINASLTTSFAVVRGAGKYMTEGGSVVLISSAAATAGLANHEAIAAAKAGIEGLIRSAAATYAPQNLRFNAVAPGLTATNLTKGITDNPASLKVSESMHALGRIGTADDIARAVAFLIDPLNAWITGEVLAVDGGLSHVRPKVKA